MKRRVRVLQPFWILLRSENSLAPAGYQTMTPWISAHSLITVATELSQLQCVSKLEINMISLSMYFLFCLMLITLRPHEAHDGDAINFSAYF
jgi:hypothetical protein